MLKEITDKGAPLIIIFLVVGPGSGFPPEGMQRRRPWPYRTVYEWLVELSSCANYPMIVDAVPYPAPPYFNDFYTLDFGMPEFAPHPLTPSARAVSWVSLMRGMVA